MIAYINILLQEISVCVNPNQLWMLLFIFFPVVLTKRDEETINNDTAKVPITGCEGWGIGFAMITNDGVNDVSECNWQAS